jgi:hypothetical protein
VQDLLPCDQKQVKLCVGQFGTPSVLMVALRMHCTPCCSCLSKALYRFECHSVFPFRISIRSSSYVICRLVHANCDFDDSRDTAKLYWLVGLASPAALDFDGVSNTAAAGMYLVCRGGGIQCWCILSLRPTLQRLPGDLQLVMELVAGRGVCIAVACQQ